MTGQVLNLQNIITPDSKAVRITEKYVEFAATSKATGKKNLIVDHVGTARHLHIQVKRMIYV